MLTPDLGLLHDDKFRALVYGYANDLDSLTLDFGWAWYKLTSHDMVCAFLTSQGPANRCKGNLVPPPQEFQATLPNPPTKSADFNKLKRLLKQFIANGGGETAAQFVDLAFQCQSSFRVTDHAGGF